VRRLASAGREPLLLRAQMLAADQQGTLQRVSSMMRCDPDAPCFPSREHTATVPQNTRSCPTVHTRFTCSPHDRFDLGLAVRHLLLMVASTATGGRSGAYGWRVAGKPLLAATCAAGGLPAAVAGTRTRGEVPSPALGLGCRAAHGNDRTEKAAWLYRRQHLQAIAGPRQPAAASALLLPP